MPAAAVVSFEPSLGHVPLSVRLEEGTAATRRETEQTPFLRNLFRGTWGTSVYGQLVRGRHYVTYLQCLLEVYGALEVALEALCTHPVVGGFLLPEHPARSVPRRAGGASLRSQRWSRNGLLRGHER